MIKALYTGFTKSGNETAIITTAAAAKYFLGRTDNPMIFPSGLLNEPDVICVGYAPAENLYAPLKTMKQLSDFFMHYRGNCELLGKFGFVYTDGCINEGDWVQSDLYAKLKELQTEVKFRFCRGYKPMPFMSVYDIEGAYIFSGTIEDELCWVENDKAALIVEALNNVWR